GETQLLRDCGTPGLEEISTEADDDPCCCEIEPGPCDAVRFHVRGNAATVEFGIVADVPRHPEACQPFIEERRKTSRFMLIDEGGIRGAAAGQLGELCAERGECLVPRHVDERAIAAKLRATITI